jgi:hypothetical protein
MKEDFEFFRIISTLNIELFQIWEGLWFLFGVTVACNELSRAEAYVISSHPQGAKK